MSNTLLPLQVRRGEAQRVLKENMTRKSEIFGAQPIALSIHWYSNCRILRTKAIGTTYVVT